MAKKKPPRVSLRAEGQPTHAQNELVARIEDAGVRWREETAEEYAKRLEKWREAEPPAKSRGARKAWLAAEPDVDELVEDRSACDFQGMSLEEYGSLLFQLLPGRVHGYYEGLPATNPTQARPGSPEKIAVLRGRLLRGERLDHPDDSRRKL
jgi:hypothetical protein